MTDETVGASPPEEVNHRHEAIADEMLANPWMTKSAIAEKLGYTVAWVSTITNSGTFQAYMAERRREFNQELAEKAQQKSLEVGMEALDKAAEGLKSGDIDPVDVFDKALNRAGMAPQRGSSGGGGGEGPVQNNYYLTASKEELAQARGVMLENHQASSEGGPPSQESSERALQEGDGGEVEDQSRGEG